MNRRMRIHLPALLLVAAVLLGVLSSLLVAAPATTKKLHVEAKKIESQKQDGKIRVTTLSTAKVTHLDAVFTADTIVINSQGDVHEFVCTGNPVFTNPENKITSEKVIGYSTPRRAEFINNVKMVTTPKKPAETTSDVKQKINAEPSTITSDSLSYDYAGRRALARGHVVVQQKQRTVWADEGTYFEDKELVVLKGNVRMKNAGNEQIKELKDADTATISLANDWVDILAKPDGVVSIELEVKDDEQKSEESAK